MTEFDDKFSHASNKNKHVYNNEKVKNLIKKFDQNYNSPVCAVRSDSKIKVKKYLSLNMNSKSDNCIPVLNHDILREFLKSTSNSVSVSSASGTSGNKNNPQSSRKASGNGFSRYFRSNSDTKIYGKHSKSLNESKTKWFHELPLDQKPIKSEETAQNETRVQKLVKEFYSPVETNNTKPANINNYVHKRKNSYIMATRTDFSIDIDSTEDLTNSADNATDSYVSKTVSKFERNSKIKTNIDDLFKKYHRQVKITGNKKENLQKLSLQINEVLQNNYKQTKDNETTSQSNQNIISLANNSNTLNTEDNQYVTLVYNQIAKLSEENYNSYPVNSMKNDELTNYNKISRQISNSSNEAESETKQENVFEFWRRKESFKKEKPEQRISVKNTTQTEEKSIEDGFEFDVHQNERPSSSYDNVSEINIQILDNGYNTDEDKALKEGDNIEKHMSVYFSSIASLLDDDEDVKRSSSFKSKSYDEKSQKEEIAISSFIDADQKYSNLPRRLVKSASFRRSMLHDIPNSQRSSLASSSSGSNEILESSKDSIKSLAEEEKQEIDLNSIEKTTPKDHLSIFLDSIRFSTVSEQSDQDQTCYKFIEIPEDLGTNPLTSSEDSVRFSTVSEQSDQDQTCYKFVETSEDLGTNPLTSSADSVRFSTVSEQSDQDQTCYKFIGTPEDLVTNPLTSSEDLCNSESSDTIIDHIQELKILKKKSKAIQENEAKPKKLFNSKSFTSKSSSQPEKYINRSTQSFNLGNSNQSNTTYKLNENKNSFLNIYRRSLASNNSDSDIDETNSSLLKNKTTPKEKESNSLQKNDSIKSNSSTGSNRLSRFYKFASKRKDKNNNTCDKNDKKEEHLEAFNEKLVFKDEIMIAENSYVEALSPMLDIYQYNRQENWGDYVSIKEIRNKDDKVENIYEVLRKSIDEKSINSFTYYDDQANPAIKLSSMENVHTDLKLAIDDKTESIIEHEKQCIKIFKEMNQNSQKACLIAELKSTEKHYIDVSLHRLVFDYMPVMNKPDLPPSLVGKVRNIFGNADILYEKHKKFYSQLDACQNENDIATCFLKYEERLFKLYPLYFKNKPKSELIMRDSGFYFKKIQEKQLRDRLDLSSYLLTPIQRMAKYCQLVRNIIKECDKENLPCPKLKIACEMLEKQMSMGNDLIALDQVIHYDGNLREQGELLLRDSFNVQPPHRRAPFEGMIFLFQESVLITAIVRQNGSELFEYIDNIQLTDMGYTDNDIESTKFRIWYRKRDQKHFVFTAKNKELKQKWVKEIFNLLWKQLEYNKRLKKEELANSGITGTKLPLSSVSKVNSRSFKQKKDIRPESIPNKRDISFSKPRSSTLRNTKKSKSDTVCDKRK